MIEHVTSTIIERTDTHTYRATADEPLLFCSSAGPDPRVGHTMNVYFLTSSAILIDFSMVSPVHVLMLSIQAVRGLSRLRAPGIVFALSLSPCSSLVSSWCESHRVTMVLL